MPGCFDPYLAQNVIYYIYLLKDKKHKIPLMHVEKIADRIQHSIIFPSNLVWKCPVFQIRSTSTPIVKSKVPDHPDFGPTGMNQLQSSPPAFGLRSGEYCEHLDNTESPFQVRSYSNQCCCHLSYSPSYSSSVNPFDSLSLTQFSPLSFLLIPSCTCSLSSLHSAAR